MPIDYSKYPPNWTSEIVPRILHRAKNRCEKCGLSNGRIVYSVKHKGRTTGWFRTLKVAKALPVTIEMKNGKLIPNPKPVRVVLTVAHLDHDECNQDVTDDRLMAMCQLCHLRYDAKEKYRRAISKRNKGQIEIGL